jgi:hypothetical protein
MMVRLGQKRTKDAPEEKDKESRKEIIENVSNKKTKKNLPFSNFSYQYSK